MKSVIAISPETAESVRKGLLRTAAGRWFHVSRTVNTIILRSLASPGEAEEHSPPSLGDAHGGATFVPYDGLRWYSEPGDRIPGRVKLEDVAYWLTLAERYDSDPELSRPPTISTTELRRYYERLRASGSMVASECVDAAKDPARLVALFVQAVEQLASYRNLREGWAPEESRKVMDAASFAREVPYRLASGELVAPVGCEYSFIERELAPLRATGADAPGSGDGGIDVLLASTDDETCLPIVVEVKSAADGPAYLALVQSITYASELITKHQRHRLSKFYPAHFSGLQQVPGPFADIWIIEEAGKDDVQLAHTRAVAARLLLDPAISGLLRRISFFELDTERKELVAVDGALAVPG